MYTYITWKPVCGEIHQIRVDLMDHPSLTRHDTYKSFFFFFFLPFKMDHVRAGLPPQSGLGLIINDLVLQSTFMSPIKLNLRYRISRFVLSSYSGNDKNSQSVWTDIISEKVKKNVGRNSSANESCWCQHHDSGWCLFDFNLISQWL